MSKRILSVVLSLALLLTTISVTGIITVASAEPVITPVTTVPAGNLVAGMRPISGIVGQTGLSSSSGTKPDLLTDGAFAQADGTGRWMGYDSTGYRLVFNLGVVTTISEFLIGSEAGAAQYADKVKIYVSDTVADPRTNLFTADNLVLDVTGLTAQNNVVKKAGESYQAIMVGFDFTGSNCIYGTLVRLGELGVYGTQNVKVADTVVTPVTAMPNATNLLVGVTPTNTNGNNVTGRDGSALSLMTDGKFCTSNTDSGSNADRFRTNYGPNDKMTWDLGGIYNIDSFLIGSENGTNEYIKQVNIYVSNDKSKLFTDGSLVLSARGYSAGIGANRDNLLTSLSEKDMIGRYVGFEFTNNNPTYGGWCGGFLRLGELGVYGVRTTNVEAVSSLPTETNLLAGLTAKTAMEGKNSINRADGNLGVAGLTDGLLVTAGAENRVGLYADGATKMYFDLGATKTIDKFLVGSEADANYYIKTVSIYVGNDQGTLFTSENLAIEVSGITAQNVLLSKEGATFSGQYVGFDFTGNSHPYFMRFGELGAYGVRATNVEAVSALPTETNLLAGLTAKTAMEGKNSINRADGNLGVAGLTDGLLVTAGAENRVGLYADGATKMYFDLGATKTIDKFLVGSEADANCYIKTVSIYVGNDKGTLFTSENLAIEVSGITAQNVLLSKEDATFSGQYVGFDFTGNSHPYFMRFGELGAYGAVDETKNYTLYNAADAPGAMTPVANNILSKATAANYRHDKATGNSANDKMLTKLVDGIISSANADKLVVGGSVNDNLTYYYFTYDMGEDYTIDTVTYAGDGSTGANSVAVYVGDKDLATIAAGGVEPSAFYDGGIGGDFVTNNKTNSHAIRFTFDQALTGRYITFRLAVCRNQGNLQVWISEFAATGRKLTYLAVDEITDLPQGDNLIAGKVPTTPNGGSIGVAPNGGNIANITDGKLQGINQPINYILSDTEQTATKGENTYYNPIAPKEFVEKYYPDYDSSKTWYFKSDNVQYRASNASSTRAMIASPSAKLVYDLGGNTSIEKLLIASTWEIQGMGQNTVTSENNVYKPTLAQVEATMTVLKGNSLLYKADVYVADTLEQLQNLSTATKVLSYDHSANKAAMDIAGLYTLEQAVEGRYVCFDLSGSTNGSLTRISELGVYGELLAPQYNYTKVDELSDLPTDTNLIAGMIPTKADGSGIGVKDGAKLANMTDGLIQGLNQENTFVLTDDEKYKTVTYPKNSENVYYTFVAPTSLVEAQGLDTSKTWYMMPTNIWLTTKDAEQRTVMFGGSSAGAAPVYDLGIECTVKSILLASAVELSGAQTNTKVEGEYDATKHPTLNDTQLTNALKPVNPDKRMLWTAKVYVGNDKATIFDEANLVLEYDLSGNYADALRNLWTLPEAKKGRYVAFDFNNCIMSAENALVRVSELAVYGERIIQDLVPGVNVVSMGNFPNIPANLLQGSIKQSGKINQGCSTPLETLYDGNIGGINVAAGSSVNFDGNRGGTITTVDGNQIKNVNGTANIAFQLENISTIDKILVAGSAGDRTDYEEAGVKYDNRNVLYYEVYISDNYSNLYSEANRVLAYDNSEDPQLALIHVLDTPVRGSYVGFKVTCGVYSLARLSELGVYGTMDPLPTLPFTGFDSKAEMDALVNGQKNLLKGEAVEGNPLDYLVNMGSAYIENEQWLTDDYIDWTAVAEGEGYKKVEYSNSSFDRTIAYDLLGEVDFSGLLISATGVEGSAYRPQRVTVYISDDDDTLFDSTNMLGVALLRGANVGAYIDLSGVNAQGRYIGIMVPGDTQYYQVRIAELGAYGTYISGPSKYPVNLLAGDLPVYHKEISARSIDNRTAVDINGHPGSGNTGEFTGDIKNVWKHDDLALLTDGSTGTRSSQWSSASPYGQVHEKGSNILHYDSNWMVMVYKLDGGTRIDEIKFSSSNEPDYYVSGVQYYASVTYADLFKNESLLYTTGGEYYVVDEENSTAEEILYLPDASMDKNQSQHIEYLLTEEQKATNYRYVAIVMTRPHSMWKPSNPTTRLEGYSMFRAAEIAVYGEVVDPEDPIKDTYVVKTSVGNVSVQVGTLHFDDRDFFDKTLAGVKVTETKLSADVKRHIDDNWLSVDNDTVFTFQLVDKKGKPIAETTDDEALGLNGRELELQFPSTAKYVQTMAVLEDGVLRRLYNSFTNVQNDRKINAGCLAYPAYDDSLPNNRDKATLTGNRVSLVYMKANDFATVNKLSNRVVNDSLADFIAGGGVAGVSGNAASASPLWYILPVLAVAGATAVTIVLRMRRKARRDGQ